MFKHIDSPTRLTAIKNYENRKKLLRRKSVLENERVEAEKKKRRKKKGVRAREEEAMAEAEARESAATALLELTAFNLPEQGGF